MAIDRAELAGDYSLVITKLDRLKGPWGWEIRRKSNQLGIKNYDNNFKTESAARVAGEKALKEFLGAHPERTFGSLFKNILNTLNHPLVADRMWWAHKEPHIHKALN